MASRKTSPAAELRRSLGFMSEAELSTLVGVTLATARNRQSAGSFAPAYKIGREKLYRIDEVDAWIRRRRVARGAA